MLHLQFPRSLAQAHIVTFFILRLWHRPRRDRRRRNHRFRWPLRRRHPRWRGCFCRRHRLRIPAVAVEHGWKVAQGDFTRLCRQQEVAGAHVRVMFAFLAPMCRKRLLATQARVQREQLILVAPPNPVLCPHRAALEPMPPASRDKARHTHVYLFEVDAVHPRCELAPTRGMWRIPDAAHQLVQVRLEPVFDYHSLVRPLWHERLSLQRDSAEIWHLRDSGRRAVCVPRSLQPPVEQRRNLDVVLQNQCAICVARGLPGREPAAR
mmetsp:Transcript_148075/g.475482  ORF Transcript_148075/g.475482 Transcript_148075/m.475482 type:complete len:265 (-) Transcript_148075:526-1320(-)